MAVVVVQGEREQMEPLVSLVLVVQAGQILFLGAQSSMPVVVVVVLSPGVHQSRAPEVVAVVELVERVEVRPALRVLQIEGQAAAAQQIGIRLVQAAQAVQVLSLSDILLHDNA